MAEKGFGQKGNFISSVTSVVRKMTQNEIYIAGSSGKQSRLVQRSLVSFQTFSLELVSLKLFGGSNSENEIKGETILILNKENKKTKPISSGIQTRVQSICSL